MFDLLRIIAARLERIEHLECTLERIESTQTNLKRHIMSLEQQLLDAAAAKNAADAALNAKVDALIGVADASAAALQGLISQGGETVSAESVKTVIDMLTAGTAAAATEAGKVDAAVAADAPPAPAPAPAVDAPAAPVDGSTDTPVDPAP